MHSMVQSIPNLNPFIAEGILRIRDCLENAPMSFQTKHPVILPSTYHMTNLIIQNCHRQQGQCGPSQVLAYIRQRFWIVCGLSAVRRILAKCINYRKQKAFLVNKLWLHSHQQESLRQIHCLPMWVWTISVPSVSSKDTVK